MQQARTGWSRRAFLRRSALTVGLAGLVRLPPPAALAAPRSAGLQVLSEDEADLIAAIAERMVFSGDPAMPAVRDTDTVFVIDQALLQADASLRTQLRWLLRLFDWGPLFFQFRFARFRSLDDEGRDAYIRGWATSRLTERRIGFQALKNLAMLGYYADDQTWKGIGYHGPWAPRPRRVLHRGDA